MNATLDLKSDFPILAREIHGRPLAYLDNAATTQKPLCVIERVSNFYRTRNSNIHRGVHSLSEESSTLYEDARETVRAFIGAGDMREIVFTAGTTDAINLLARALGDCTTGGDAPFGDETRYSSDAQIGEGDEILVTGMEHHSNLLPWQDLCRRRGAVLRVLPLERNGTLHMEDISRRITSRTRLVAVTHVSNVTGIVNPVEELVRHAHDRGALVLVDGAQAVAHMPVDVASLDCDFYVFSGHKMFAENGIGVLYGKAARLEELPPARVGGGMVTSVTLESRREADLPLRFEAGTPNYPAAVSLAEAIRYLQRIGMQRIREHENTLHEYMREQLVKVGGLTVYGSAPEHSGSVAFNLDGIQPYDAGMIMDRMGVAVRTGTHCAEPLMRHFDINGCIRASLALYNDTDDIDRLAEAVRKAQSMLG